MDKETIEKIIEETKDELFQIKIENGEPQLECSVFLKYGNN